MFLLFDIPNPTLNFYHLSDLLLVLQNDIARGEAQTTPGG